jgi:hypothetical protein
MFKYQKDKLKFIKNQLTYESRLRGLTEILNRANKRKRIIERNLLLFTQILSLIVIIYLIRD